MWKINICCLTCNEQNNCRIKVLLWWWSQLHTNQITYRLVWVNDFRSKPKTYNRWKTFIIIVMDPETTTTAEQETKSSEDLTGVKVCIIKRPELQNATNLASVSDIRTVLYSGQIMACKPIGNRLLKVKELERDQHQTESLRSAVHKIN